MRIRNSKDFYSGVIFIFFGVVAMVVARNYPMGSTLRMGPGYFPTLLGSVLTFLGLAIVARSFWIRGEAIKSLAPRPIALVLGAVLAFAFLIERTGLVIATVALVAISRLSEEFRFLEVTALALLMAAVAVALFVYGLGLPFSIWPQ
jgi:hypothetical protein